MLTADLTELLIVADKAVDLGSSILRSASGPGRLTSKGDRDFATDVDFKIERELRHHLSRATPQLGFLGEEEGSTGDQGGLRWALDPIDGTVNFAHGLPLHAVSLALISGDQPVLGVIDLPALATRYHAAIGLGAYRGDQRLACPAPPKNLASAVVAIGDYAVGPNADVKNQKPLAVTTRLAATVLRVRMLGSAAIDLAWLAEGRLDALITLSNKTWDMAAGVVLVRETGHIVVDTDGEDYSLASSAIIAGHPALMPDLLAMADLTK
jgi:myo-inositol-1(or 4)-monophosphatase